MKRSMISRVSVLVGLLLGFVGSAGAGTIAMPDGSITTPAGSYGQSFSFFDTVQNPKSPDRWNIVASDLTFQGQVKISDINSKARWNTWDDTCGVDSNPDDGIDNLGAWYMCGLYAGGGKGVWLTSPQWTGGGDAATDIRSIFHMQDRQGTQPDPKYYTNSYTRSGWEWLDGWFNFKLVVHATSNTTGTAQLYIHDELVNGQGGVPNPGVDTFNFDITGASDNLTNTRVIMWMINGNNPNNPSYTLDWQGVSVTGTPVPEPATMALLAAGGIGMLVRRRRNK